MKVFLVEAEHMVRDEIMYQIPWEKQGFIFRAASGRGEEALSEVVRDNPQIVIIDVHLPSIDGLELSRRIKERIPEIKILLISEYRDFNYAKAALSIGVSDYLEKPVNTNGILEAVLRVSGQIELIKKRESDRLYACRKGGLNG